MNPAMLHSIHIVRRIDFLNGRWSTNNYEPGGAFQPPPESGLAPSPNAYADGVIVNP